MGSRKKVTKVVDVDCETGEVKRKKKNQVIYADNTVLCKVEFEELLKKHNCEVKPSLTIKGTGDIEWNMEFVVGKK